MSEKYERPLPFDPTAFALALIGGPLVFTLILSPTIIPIFALIFGGPVYLAVGTPVLLWMVGRFPPQAEVFIGGGALGCFALAALAALVQPALIMGALVGIPFAGGWCLVFILFYRRFNRMPRVLSLS